ncbi:hypothetical protein MNBD_GAMMA13-1394 [hydrothermal vent metagenome]|uniref:Uncharacterized protein n=1 Tax=hydrothermal vent metagenome TaxID=652676 RepID=A0A3B0YPW1_9ZZZZ
MVKKLRRVLLAGVATTSVAGGVSAVCPDDLTPQLLEDCIVVEGSGSVFPNASYANIAQYREWRATKYPQIAQAVNAAIDSPIYVDPSVVFNSAIQR